ncbi:Capsular polysaccharide biosynthesis protein [Eubacterium ruminantium]|uniref:Capsular polysaccharide biosynthesis protein n=1 Tax=Eubacterium ruminantium TaxID=42322 RepID=A0A1T4KZR3_9FIRM|nr:MULTISPECIES: hypothetical protein [Eubacterium]MCR5368099.1 hypothetical protein [Eubacterium sp.]SCW42351.1 Capsular polysaccharide biosynthesis protein [Eubacterium ruminantium]SDN20486.1 Capsular polysaccharide biosynthesis protein [Eubacterium ruminantium]SJZ47974.1 Capsular polysaccharide biosynthesis protein [Eubacterium ruminantium]
MRDKTREIDILYFFNYLKSKIAVIALTVFVCAGLIGAYDYKRQKGVRDESAKDRLKAAMEQNHDAFYFGSKKFTDAEQPAGIYNSTARLYVDFDYDDIEGFENAKISFLEINSKYETDATTILKDSKNLDEIITELDLRSYDDMKDITADDLQWLVNKNFTGAHVLNIVVSDVNPERAKLICDAVADKTMSSLKTYDFVDKVEKVSSATLPENTGFTLLKSSVKDINKKQLLKFAIVGGALGFILIIAFLFLMFAFTDKIYSETDIASAGMKFAVGPRRKKFDSGRVARSIALFEGVSKILLVSIDGNTNAPKDAEDINKELKSLGSKIKVIGAADFESDNEALDKVKECDSVIYMVRYGKSEIGKLVDAEEELSRSTKTLGVLVR